MTSQHDKAQRWRPRQFSLSTLLLLITLVAVAVGWWADRRHLVVGIENLRQNVEVLKAAIQDEKRALEFERSKLDASRKMQMLHAESIQSYIRNIQTLKDEVEELRRMQGIQLPEPPRLNGDTRLNARLNGDRSILKKP